MVPAERADVHLWSYARQAGRAQDEEVELEKGREELKTQVLTGCSLFFKLMAEALPQAKQWERTGSQQEREAEGDFCPSAWIFLPRSSSLPVAPPTVGSSFKQIK